MAVYGLVTEHDEQVCLMQWAALHEWMYPELELLFAIPNGGFRKMKTAITLKKEGVKSGVPDLFLPVSRGVWHGLFIEMKSSKGNMSGPQRYWQRILRQQSYKVEMCRGFESAKEVIIEYINTGRRDDP